MCFRGGAGAGAGFPVFCAALNFTKMIPAVAAPSFGGEDFSSVDYERRVRLRRHVVNLDSPKEAAALTLHMGNRKQGATNLHGKEARRQGSRARQICMAR